LVSHAGCLSCLWLDSRPSVRSAGAPVLWLRLCDCPRWEETISLCVCVHSAKGFQHHRMTNGAMNVEIGNPAYKIYEGEPDDDAGELLDSDFALDPDKPTNFTNPVYATLYMGAHNSRSSLASTDEKKELLSQGDDGEDEDMSDPLA
ncbi:unnamed protein product, partial [Oncorhynchus mykiss]